MASLWPVLSSAYNYDIADGNVNVVESAPYLISGTSTVNTITVNTGVTADITISNLYIQVTNRYQCAFSIASNATVNLRLAGSNYLMSGREEAALHVPIGATLNIADGDGSGILTAMGGGQGPGIGGGHMARGGRITIISGNITAIGGFGAAGIGCGDFGKDGGILTIAGGTVVAQGGSMGEGGCGAGIGGGNASAGGVITITGGKVTATGGIDVWPEGAGAGIGGGYTQPGGLITITGGTVYAMRGTHSWGSSSAEDIGTGGATTEIGTNIFTGGSIKTSVNSIWGAPVDADSNAVYLLTVSNAVDGTNSVDISLTNMQTGAVYSYIGAGHGDGDRNLYFYLPAGDYPAYSEELLGYFVNADGTSGGMTHNPSDWANEQRTIAAVSVNGGANVLTLMHPLGSFVDNFRIEGADKVEENGWNWSAIPHATDDHGVITIDTHAPSLMLRIQYKD